MTHKFWKPMFLENKLVSYKLFQIMYFTSHYAIIRFLIGSKNVQIRDKKFANQHVELFIFQKAPIILQE